MSAVTKKKFMPRSNARSTVSGRAPCRGDARRSLEFGAFSDCCALAGSTRDHGGTVPRPSGRNVQLLKRRLTQVIHESRRGRRQHTARPMLSCVHDEASFTTTMLTYEHC